MSFSRADNLYSEENPQSDHKHTSIVFDVLFCLVQKKLLDNLEQSKLEGIIGRLKDSVHDVHRFLAGH